MVTSIILELVCEGAIFEIKLVQNEEGGGTWREVQGENREAGRQGGRETDAQ